MPHTACATVAADVHVLALVCVMNSVVVPWLVVALLARRQAAMSTSTQALSLAASTQPAAASMSTCTQCARPPSMSALTRRRFSLSDSALLGKAEGPLSTSNGGTVHERTRRSTRPPPLTMHAAVCSALGPRLSRSDSALLGKAEGPLSTSNVSTSNGGTVHEHGVRTSPSTPTMRPLMRTSPVFARMLANTREAPATPRRVSAAIMKSI
jgi:hypothetical protein